MECLSLAPFDEGGRENERPGLFGFQLLRSSRKPVEESADAFEGGLDFFRKGVVRREAGDLPPSRLLGPAYGVEQQWLRGDGSKMRVGLGAPHSA